MVKTAGISPQLRGAERHAFMVRLLLCAELTGTPAAGLVSG
jgi:hypothetical protein